MGRWFKQGCWQLGIQNSILTILFIIQTFVHFVFIESRYFFKFSLICLFFHIKIIILHFEGLNDNSTTCFSI